MPPMRQVVADSAPRARDGGSVSKYCSNSKTLLLPAPAGILQDGERKLMQRQAPHGVPAFFREFLMLIFLAMLLLGGIVGFVGAGGAGVTIALLTAFFGVPVHTALGTSLAGMMFTTLSGAVSHFREGNVLLRLGASIGLFGAVGAFAGASFSSGLDGDTLRPFTGVVLLLSSWLFYLKIFRSDCRLFRWQVRDDGALRHWLHVGGLGLFNGLLSGAFGVGAAPFIQLTLLIVFHVPLYMTVGTTMMVILPIAAMGGAGYLWHGHLDPVLFAQVLSGQMLGAYIGAKFTRLAPLWLLRACVVLTPATGGLILLLE